MGLSCGSQCAKILLFIFNFLFWLAGAAMLALGIWFMVDSNAPKYLNIATVDVSDAMLRASAITIIVVGAFVFLTGFLGCCGALKESPCMLTSYAVVLILLLILQVAAGILAAVFRSRIQSELVKSMNTTMTMYYGHPDKDTETDSFDFMQKSFKCCGVVEGPSDWVNTYWYESVKLNNQSVPNSCCVLSDYASTTPVDAVKCNNAAKGINMTDASKYLYSDPCGVALSDWIDTHAGILIGVAFGIAALEVIGVVFACVLKGSLHKSGYEYV